MIKINPLLVFIKVVMFIFYNKFLAWCTYDIFVKCYSNVTASRELPEPRVQIPAGKTMEPDETDCRTGMYETPTTSYCDY